MSTPISPSRYATPSLHLELEATYSQNATRTPDFRPSSHNGVHDTFS